MIRKYKAKDDIFQRRIRQCSSFYAIESIVYEELIYVLADNELAMIRGTEAWRMPWDDLPALAEHAIDADLKQEMLDIAGEAEDLIIHGNSLENCQMRRKKKAYVR